MTTKLIIDAIQSIRKGAQVTVYNNDIDQIVWNEGEEVISKSDIQTAYDNLPDHNANAINKLKALGLTDAEISALTDKD